MCTVTITHDVTGAPMVAGMVPGGGDPAKGGGGWPWVLSDLKSLLETGARMPKPGSLAQSRRLKERS